MTNTYNKKRFDKIEIFSTRIKNLGAFESLKDLLHKKVFSKSGEYIGRVYDVMVKNNIVEGLIIKSKTDLFIEKEYINSDSEESIMLLIDPVISIVGKQVFDNEGVKVGYVSKIERKTNANNFESLLVKKKIYSKGFKITKDQIAVCKDNILLKISMKDETR